MGQRRRYNPRVSPRRRESGLRYRANDAGCRPAARSRRTTARQLGQKTTHPAHLHRHRPTLTGGDGSRNRPTAQGNRGSEGKKNEFLGKASAVLAHQAAVPKRFELMAQEKANYPVTMMARVLGVSPSGFYPWSKRAAARSAGAVCINTTSMSRSAGPITAPGVPMVLQESPLDCMQPMWTSTVKRLPDP